MLSEDIFRRLTDILREVFDDDDLVATPELTADDVLGWDSFGNIRLIQTIEHSFKIEFNAPEVYALRNVGELAELIAARASEAHV